MFNLPRPPPRRVERWIEVAARQRTAEDTCFINYWIGFNALYGRAHSGREWGSDANDRREFLKAVSSRDPASLLTALEKRDVGASSGNLLLNPRLSPQAWRKGPTRRVKEELTKRRSHFEDSLKRKQPEQCLDLLFPPLAELRNQLFHGCSTGISWDMLLGIRDGIGVLGILLPLFVDIVRRYPGTDWGRLPHFPSRTVFNRMRLMSAGQ